jgi:two-component system, NtrC family, sensor kinase
MKILAAFVIILNLCFSTVRAQEEVVTLESGMFQPHQRIFLAPLDGWLFKQGHDPNWANPDLDISGWEKMNLTALNPKMKDESGRIEGWFRIKIRLDESLSSIPFYVNRNLWAATDIYLDGKLIHSFGDTGEPYQAFNPTLKYPVPLDLIPGRDYLLAVHFVDYESTFTQREIRLNPVNLEPFLNLAGPAYVKWVDRDHKQTHIYVTLCIGISFLLSFLYWFLAYLNPEQKIFQLIAGFTTVVLVGTLVIFGNTFFEMTYGLEKVRFIIFITFQAVMVIFGLFILEWVLTRQISRASWVIIGTLLIANILAHIFSISFPFGILFSLMLLHFGRIFYAHRQEIRGAIWTFLAGSTIATLATLIYIFLHKYDLDLYNNYDKLLLSMTILSTPLFLLAYLSVRFRETFQAEKEKAKKILEISEEKKVLLANQNKLLEEQVNERTEALEKSLADLKSTQAQLIQSEMMASLGELTAGIAHEIQNPLNFVNNFSEVSKELIDEMKEELAAGSLQSAVEIADDISQNLEKINHHGKRAGSIVKGMLEHSRKSDGKKELTDLNALAEEYLKLSYHGLRAKDKSFNAEFKTAFDPDLPKLNVIPQDIGRVLLNLINNAFQAVSGLSMDDLAGFQNLSDLEPKKPLVTVSTKNLGDKVEISIKDNGPGIPDSIKDKIFQPFFTTKPTGQGTGLGLSLSYDIVKAYGGNIEVETQSKKGTKFTVKLPIS